jgi:two-component system KDP operon response regulator KdpE
MRTVLVVDDDAALARALRISLRAHGYDVVVAVDGRAALRAAAEAEPDLVLLDVGLPELDGIDVIHGLRGWSDVPVIVLSGRASSAEKIAALDAGADDYLTKPFRVDELLARMRAVGRRSGAAAPAVTARIGDWVVDLGARRVQRAPEAPPGARSPGGGAADAAGPAEVRLTPTEWHLLDVLVRNPEKLLTHRELLPATGGPAPAEASHYLRQYVARLRRKLEPDPTRPRHLLTEPGLGYRFPP